MQDSSYWQDLQAEWKTVLVLFAHVFPVSIGGSRGGGQGVQTPLKNNKNTGFLRNTGPDPLKNHKATKPAFKFGALSACQRNTI